MNRCARCSWQPSEAETLGQHAVAAAHPLCAGCGESLPSDRPQVCRDCQDAAATQLHEVLTMWEELPDLLEAAASARIPGGDALVLAGPGARGAQGADDYDTSWLISDNRNADMPSVAWTLVSWADDWQHVRGEREADRDNASGQDAVVRSAHAYLVEQSAWAAAEHWAWAEYAGDLGRLHGALLRATGRHRAPRRLGLSCFACRGPLVYRVVRDEDAAPPPSRPRWWVAPGVEGPVDPAEWARRHLGTAGLEEENATCRTCGQTYDAAALLLAQRQAVEDAQWLHDDDGTRWGTVRAVAEVVDRSSWSVRAWQRTGLVRAHQHNGVTYLHLPDVEAQSEMRPRRPARDTPDAARRAG